MGIKGGKSLNSYLFLPLIVVAICKASFSILFFCRAKEAKAPAHGKSIAFGELRLRSLQV